MEKTRRFIGGIKTLIFLGLGLVFLDRFTKWFILNHPDFSLGKVVELKLFKNSKLYFFSFNQKILYFLIGSALLLLIFMFFKSCQKKEFLLMTGFSLIILGGLSNFFDRIIFGYVIDWIKLYFLPISIFNIADLMIIGGIICVLISNIKHQTSKLHIKNQK